VTCLPLASASISGSCVKPLNRVATNLQPGTFVRGRCVDASDHRAGSGGTYRPLPAVRHGAYGSDAPNAANRGHSGRRPRTIERTPERAKGPHRRSRAEVTGRATMSESASSRNAFGRTYRSMIWRLLHQRSTDRLPNLRGAIAMSGPNRPLPRAPDVGGYTPVVPGTRRGARTGEVLRSRDQGASSVP